MRTKQKQIKYMFDKLLGSQLIYNNSEFDCLHSKFMKPVMNV